LLRDISPRAITAIDEAVFRYFRLAFAIFSRCRPHYAISPVVSFTMPISFAFIRFREKPPLMFSLSPYAFHATDISFGDSFR